MTTVVHYLPIATTAFCAVFASVLYRHWRRHGGAHLAWWTAGVVCFGVGTALESAITLLGNSAWLTKTWFAAGAMLGGYPLAQGSVWLLARPSAARRLTAISLPIVVAAVALTLASPVRLDVLEAQRPSGDALEWQWLRRVTPLINSYAALFLVGGAAWSAWQFARRGDAKLRAVGTSLIAVGAMLPAIGGAMAKGGLVEALYVGELVGIVLIWAGHAACASAPASA